jgi:mRNA-degrading endonuclease RelE of RelBE toxin-antitoxin system
MAYNLTILPKAQEEIQKAFEYYVQISVSVLTNFDNQLEEVYQNLEKNPFYQVRYKHLRAIPFKSFPYLVFFDVDQDNTQFTFTRCFIPHKTQINILVFKQ